MTSSLEPRRTPLRRVVFSPDGKLFATCGEDTATVWNVNTRGEEFSIREKQSVIRALAFSIDSKQFAFGHGNNGVIAELKILDAQTGKEFLAIKEKGKGVVGTVLFSACGKYLINSFSRSGFPGAKDDDGLVSIRDAKTGQPVCVFQAYSASLGDLALSPDGRWLAAADMRKVRIWDFKKLIGEK